MKRIHRLAAAGCGLLAVAGAGTGAQAPTIDGPPAPVAPEVITRAANGQATVRAIKLTAPLKVDGILDEEVYTREKPFGGLIQVTPRYGEPQSERSDVWITYDDTHIYLSCRCYDSAPPDEWIINELRRDTNGLRQNDHIGAMFDTFYDRRSGFGFYTNALGARADYSIVDEGGSNTDWNPVWTSKGGRFDGGWTVEMAIPFKSLRYRPGPNQVWGIQLRRSVRRKNEWAYLTPVPQILAGPQAFNRVSAAGTLVGLDLPDAGRNIELKPYVISRLTTDRLRTPAVSGEFEGDIGGDMKYAITPNLTADLTVNTDFAQVEIDEQQVNLTRFSLFFPEKRDFFLEGRGIFDFARGGTGVGGFGASDLPYLFYSRRIGLNANRIVPIDVGGRITGKIGPYAIGLMNIQAGAEPVAQTEPTNYSVLRLKRDVFARSSIGVMATNRSRLTGRPGSNQAFGVDGAFLISQDFTLGSYWAKTETTGLTGDDQSWQARADYSTDRYGARGEFLSIGANFRPEVGFTRRTDISRSYGELRFSPRPRRLRGVRKFTFTGSGEYIENGAGAIESRAWSGSIGTEFESSDQFQLGVERNYEFLHQPFTPAGSPVPIPAGGYTVNAVSASFTFGAHRAISGTVTVQAGDYYDGTIRGITLGPGGFASGGRISILKQLSLEPAISLTRIELPTATFTTRLARTRIDYGFSPLMFLSALLQYNSADRALSTNLRYRWEYAPGSEFFLVYTDERDMTDDGFTPQPAVRGLKNRAFVVKLNRLWRF